MQHGNPYITQRDKTRKALLHPVRIPRGGTHILQKAYVTCHENMGGGGRGTQLAAFLDVWQPGIQKGGHSSDE